MPDVDSTEHGLALWFLGLDQVISMAEHNALGHIMALSLGYEFAPGTFRHKLAYARTRTA